MIYLCHICEKYSRLFDENNEKIKNIESENSRLKLLAYQLFKNSILHKEYLKKKSNYREREWVSYSFGKKKYLERGF